MSEIEIFKKLADPKEDTAYLRREFLQYHSDFQPVKKSIPEILYTDSSELLRKIFNHSNGIVFGEEHFDNVTAGFIVDHMEYMQSLGVRKLFFEGLFYGLEKGVDGLRDEKDSTHPEYARLIGAAQKFGIEIIGIDSRGCKRGEGATRDVFMNAYAQRIINHHAANEKWIALVGMMHVGRCVFVDPANFMRHNVRGISEMTGAMGFVIDPLKNDQEPYIKYNGQFKAAPAKYINADIIYGIQYNKIISGKYPGHDNHIEGLSAKIGGFGYILTHYDIDSHAKFDTQTKQYIKAIIFAFRKADAASGELEQLKLAIKAEYGRFKNISEKNWLRILVDSENNEIVFSCPDSIVGIISEVVAGCFEVIF